MARFSDFIRNATPEEKERVYGQVIDMAVLAQRCQVHGCRKPNICNMDFTRGYDPDTAERHVNRLCVTCYRHWAGPVGAVKEYSQAEWDACVDASWQPEAAG